MKTISPIELNNLLQTSAEVALIDVRTPVEFEQVHVSAATNIPSDTLRPGRLFNSRRLAAGQPIYLICRTGSRAARAAETFASEGFDQGIVVQGGAEAWINAGLAVERSARRSRTCIDHILSKSKFSHIG